MCTSTSPIDPKCRSTIDLQPAKILTRCPHRIQNTDAGLQSLERYSTSIPPKPDRTLQPSWCTQTSQHGDADRTLTTDGQRSTRPRLFALLLAPKLWNKLPVALRTTHSLTKFHHNLKTHLQYSPPYSPLISLIYCISAFVVWCCCITCLLSIRSYGMPQCGAI